MGEVVGRKREREALPKTSLSFLKSDTIVATFVTREDTRPALSSRENSDPNHRLRLRTIFLDGDTGQIIKTEALPSDSRLASIVAAHEGKFVTQVGTTLTLYSFEADGVKELRSLSLPPPPEGVSRWRAYSSTTGKSVLFEAGIPSETSEKPWIWVDTENLQILKSWRQAESGLFGVSDRAIAMTACTRSFYHCAPRLALRGITTEWKDVAQIEKQPTFFGIPAQFVNDETIFLGGDSWSLLNLDGRVVLTQTDKSEATSILASADGKRFVIPIFKLVGRALALDIGGRGEFNSISIYDAPFQNRSYKLDVKGSKIRSISDTSVAELALSPDGSELAILFEEAIYLFQLPPPPNVR